MNVKDISIVDFLESIGVPTRKQGNRYFASSPFSRDSNWSFCIYPTNTYFDWSTGNSGDIVRLVMKLYNFSYQDAIKYLINNNYEAYKPHNKHFKKEDKSQKDFKLEKYINHNEEECEKIHAYANSRGIKEGYLCGLVFTRKMDCDILSRSPDWRRNPALGFVHVDKNLNPCGIKLRRIDNQEPRFSARGNLGLYILGIETVNQDLSQHVLNVVEGEANANSLWTWLKEMNVPSVVVSSGGVASSNLIQNLPTNLVNLSKRLIIDYDGSEELYQQRLALYKDLDAKPIRLILPKGEDINSLYSRGEMWKIEGLLL